MVIPSSRLGCFSSCIFLFWNFYFGYYEQLLSEWLEVKTNTLLLNSTAQKLTGSQFSVACAKGCTSSQNAWDSSTRSVMEESILSLLPLIQGGYCWPVGEPGVVSFTFSRKRGDMTLAWAPWNSAMSPPKCFWCYLAVYLQDFEHCTYFPRFLTFRPFPGLIPTCSSTIQQMFECHPCFGNKTGNKEQRTMVSVHKELTIEWGKQIWLILSHPGWCGLLLQEAFLMMPLAR